MALLQNLRAARCGGGGGGMNQLLSGINPLTIAIDHWFDFLDSRRTDEISYPVLLLAALYLAYEHRAVVAPIVPVLPLVIFVGFWAWALWFC